MPITFATILIFYLPWKLVWSGLNSSGNISGRKFHVTSIWVLADTAFTIGWSGGELYCNEEFATIKSNLDNSITVTSTTVTTTITISIITTSTTIIIIIFITIIIIIIIIII